MDTITFAGDGRLQKNAINCSKKVDETLPKCSALAQEGKLDEALELLLTVEKEARMGADMQSTSRILLAIVKLCFEMKKWEKLNEYILLLSKRRGQLKQPLAKMVQQCMDYIDQTPDLETKLKLIETLRTVTDGKIYVEIERARLTRTLADIKENQGDIEKAASILYELQVETFGSMDKREKVEFLLEQMRLSIVREDFVRTQIISRKIATKYFDEKGTSDLKKKFYDLMILLNLHDKAYLLVCKNYQALYNTEDLMEKKEVKDMTLKNMVVYLLLSSFESEQSDLIHRIKKDEASFEELPTYLQLLKIFTTPELQRWRKLCSLYERELRYNTQTGPPTDVFSPNTPEGNLRWQALKDRLVEHNIRVIGKYYTKISLTRMAELLDLTVEETEDCLTKQISNGTVVAKIDRLEQIVSFGKGTLNPNEVLDEWRHNLISLMQIVQTTTHLVTKEQMIAANKKMTKSKA